MFYCTSHCLYIFCSNSLGRRLKCDIFLFPILQIEQTSLTHSPLVPFGTHVQLTVEANDAWGYIDTGKILALINLQCMLSD